MKVGLLLFLGDGSVVISRGWVCCSFSDDGSVLLSQGVGLCFFFGG